MQGTGNNTVRCIESLSCPSYDPAATTDAVDISIQLSLDGISFSVRHTDGSPLCFKRYAFLYGEAVPEAWSEDRAYMDFLMEACAGVLRDPALQGACSRACLYSDLPLQTLVPDEYFTEKDLGSYLLLEEASAAWSVFAEPCSRHADYVVFGIPATVWQLFQQHLTALQAPHHLLARMSELAAPALPFTTSVYFTSTHVLILLQHNERIVQCNAFRIHEASDLLYYVVSLIRSAGASPDQTDVCCMSNTAPLLEETVGYLTHYLPHLQQPRYRFPEDSPFRPADRSPIWIFSAPAFVEWGTIWR